MEHPSFPPRVLQLFLEALRGCPMCPPKHTRLPFCPPLWGSSHGLMTSDYKDHGGPSCCSSLSALPGLTLWPRTHCSSPPRRTHLAPSTRNAQEPSPHSSDPSLTWPSSPGLPCTSPGEIETLLRALEHLRLPHYSLCLLIGCKVAGGGDGVYQFVLCWILHTYFSICASLI